MSTSSKEYKIADLHKESDNILVSLVIKTYHFWLISDSVLNNQQNLLCTGSRFHTAMHQVQTGRTATGATRVSSFHNFLVRTKTLTAGGRSGHPGRPHPGPWARRDARGQFQRWGRGRPASSHLHPLLVCKEEVPKAQALLLSSSKTQRGARQS